MAPPPTGRAPGAAAPAPRRDRASAAPRPRPRLRIVGRAARFRPGLIGTVTISLVFTTLFVLAFLQAVLVQGQLHLDQLDRQIAEREAEKDRRAVEVATAEAPQRIQEAAAANGLVMPPDVVFLERAEVETLPGNGGAVALSLDPAAPPSTDDAGGAGEPGTTGGGTAG